MQNVRKAMIFAAGLGTRLRPLTDSLPKALVPVAGKPLLWHVINKLKSSGIEEVVVNVHHFADMLIGTLRPVWAITISALFFAIIHMNPWQAIPAFILGMFMGYVYYKTGSLKMTMLIHFTNNTIALILGNIDPLKDAESWLDIMPKSTFAIICAVSVVLIAYICYAIIYKIEPLRPEGSCDIIEPEEMIRPL